MVSKMTMKSTSGAHCKRSRAAKFRPTRWLFSVVFVLLSLGTHAQELFTVIPDAAAALDVEQTQKLQDLRDMPRYPEVQCVTLANIPALMENGILNFIIPGVAGPLEAEAYRIEAHTPENYVLYSRFKTTYLDEEEQEQETLDGSMILTRDGVDFSGQITLPGSGDIYELWSLGDGKHIVARLDMSWFDQFECASFARYEEGPGSPSTSSPCTPVVKLMILYTAGAKSATANIDQLINDIMIYQNGAIYNSAGSTAGLSFQLAHKQQIGFSETGNIGNDVDNLAGDITIQNLRMTHKADIVMILTRDTYGGIAGASKILNANIADAYAIVTAPNAIGRFTFMHELGHLMGAMHQQSGVCNGNPDDDPGIAHGYKVNTGFLGARKVKTIMANTLGSCGSRGREHYYSTPNKSIFNKAIGTANNNVTQWLLDNACRFASYYQEGGSNGGLSVVINGPLQANAYANVNFNAITSGIPLPINYSWAISFEGFSYFGTGGNSINLSEFMNDEDHLWVKLTASNGGLSGTDFHKVKNIDNPWSRRAPEESEITENAHHLRVYPNPAKDELNIYFTSDAADHVMVKVYDLQGKLLIDQSYDVEAMSFNNPKVQISNLAPGSYYLSLKSAEHEVRKIFVVAP